MDGEGTLSRGHSNGGRGLRRQRSLEWRERRGYGNNVQSSSDDDDSNIRHGVVGGSVSGRGSRSPGPVFASLLAQQYNGVGERSYRTGSDTEGAATTDNPTSPFPTPPPTLTPNHRQASPFPLESTNSRRHHYSGSVSSERTTRNGNGEAIYAAPTKKPSSGGGTLSRRSRRGHASAMSSSSTASDRSETVFPDEHSRMHLNNDNGRDSPPEPAPPEVPPRGPSLHATHTLRSQQSRNGCPPNSTGGFTLPTDQVQSEPYSGKSQRS